MADYKAPLGDRRFVLNEVFEDAKLWTGLPALADSIDAQTVEATLGEAGKVICKRVAPLSRAADEQGCHLIEGAVSIPADFPQAFQTYAEGGWVSVCGDPTYGGVGMPKAMSAQVEEMVNSANLAFDLYPMQTIRACLSIRSLAAQV